MTSSGREFQIRGAATEKARLVFSCFINLKSCFHFRNWLLTLMESALNVILSVLLIAVLLFIVFYNR